MKQEIDQMMPCRFETKELNVQQMGDPGQGMPIAGIGGTQGPGQAFHGEAGLDIGIFCHIGAIVIIKERMILDMPVDQCCQEGKQKRDP